MAAVAVVMPGTCCRCSAGLAVTLVVSPSWWCHLLGGCAWDRRSQQGPSAQLAQPPGWQKHGGTRRCWGWSGWRKTLHFLHGTQTPQGSGTGGAPRPQYTSAHPAGSHPCTRCHNPAGIPGLEQAGDVGSTSAKQGDGCMPSQVPQRDPQLSPCGFHFFFLGLFFFFFILCCLLSSENPICNR